MPAQLPVTVYCLLLPDSHVTVPLLDFTKYLYWKLVPTAKLTFPVQTGLLLVYPVALKAIALSVFQLPS